MVTEMMAILKHTISDDNIKAISDQKYQNCGQKHRVIILKQLNLIDAKIKTSFDIIRDKRNKHLHSLFINDQSLQKDALLFYKNVSKLADFLLVPEGFQNVKALFSLELVKYLRKNGVIS